MAILGLAALGGLAFLWFPNLWKMPRDKWGPMAAFARSQLVSFAFYGKVVDQDEVPIADADVELLSIQMGSSRGGNVHLKSDAGGLFSMTGLRGVSLGVQVRKPGYYLMESKDKRIGWTEVFHTIIAEKSALHLPEKDDPAVFHLYKPKQTQPLIHLARSFEIPKDGTPKVIELGTASDHTPLQIQARCWLNDEQKNESYDWRFDISVIDGKLSPRKSKWLFMAPDSGYEKNADGCEMARGSTRWRNGFKGDYFVRFNNGVYGRFYVRMYAYGGHIMDVDAYINPAVGSRELEAEPRRD